MARHIIYSDKDFKDAYNHIGHSQLRVVDTETTGLIHHRDYIVGVCVWARDESFYFPFRHMDGKNINDADTRIRKLGEMLHGCETLMGDPTQIVGYNYQYDVKMWAADNVPLPEVWDDPILAAHLCNENEKSFKMEYLAERYVNVNAGRDEKELLKAIKNKFPTATEKGLKGKLCYMDAEIVGPYGMQDVETTLDLHGFYKWALKTQGLNKLYKEQRYFARALAKIEMEGLLLDRERLEINSKGAVEEAERLKKVFNKMAGHRVNPNSSKQMQALLGVGSTAANKISVAPGEGNPKIKGAPELLLYRKMKKAESTYYQPFRELVSAEGYIYPNLRIVGGWAGADSKGGTVSGRLSAQHPNLQATTRGSGEEYNARDVFVAPRGWRLVEEDLSQAELRLSSHYGEVAQMAQMFKDDIDVHQGVADQLGLPRHIAKNVNFSFLYGIGPKSFAEKYFMSFSDAKAYLNTYDAQYPGFRRLFKSCENFAKKHGYIAMFTGRRRHFNSRRVFPRDAMNNLIQGGVGEMIRIGITRCDNEVCGENAKMILSVHDSIMFMVRDDDDYVYTEFIPKTKAILEDQPWCSVPIKADFKEGYRWGEMKEVEL